MNWTEFGTTVGSTATALAALAYVSQALFTKLLDKDLESFKIQLRASHERELESLKAELRVAAYKREATFSKLHERRFQVIEELYSRVVKNYEDFASLMKPFQGRGEKIKGDKIKDAVQSGNGLVEFFDEHRYYFDESFCGEVDGLIKKLKEAWIEYTLMDDISGVVSREELLEKRRSMKAAWDIMDKQVPAIKIRIEKKLREAVGVVEKQP